MSEAQATWSADGSYLPQIDPHTQAKHRILEAYIENLIITLYGTGQHGLEKFTFVDGFCGGGIYDNRDNKQPWYGSPIRIINAVREGYKKSRRTYPLDVKFIFIDNNPDHLNCLKYYSMPQSGFEELIDEQPHEFISEWGKRVEQCEFMYGKFEDLVNECVFKVDIRKGHSFFLLDPFGWSHVSMSSIRKINSLGKSEIVYTYMIDFLKIYVLGKHGKNRDSFNKILEADGYYELADLENMDSFGEQSYYRNESMRLFRDKGNAKYIFTFSLIPRGEVRVLYYLIHISSNLRALEVMKDSFWQENNLDYQYHFEIYGYGFQTATFYEKNQIELSFDITKDSYEICMDKLDRDVGKLIFDNPGGISFQEIRKTMPLNPANRKLYNKYLNRYISEKELEVWRSGELLKKKQIEFRNNDIIKVVSKYQTSLFYKSKFFSTDL
jgi:three-Cys-motif partner protein